MRPRPASRGVRSSLSCVADRAPAARRCRIEHPQSLIDVARLGRESAGEVQRGKGRIPVAEYKLACEVQDPTFSPPSTSSPPGGGDDVGGQGGRPGRAREGERRGGGGGGGAAHGEAANRASGLLREASERRVAGQVGGAAAAAAVEEYGGGGGGGRAVPDGLRSVFSFCMCPGGQIVCTATREEELCLNGMSFRCAVLVGALLDAPCLLVRYSIFPGAARGGADLFLPRSMVVCVRVCAAGATPRGPTARWW